MLPQTKLQDITAKKPNLSLTELKKDVVNGKGQYAMSNVQ
jgi:hypothetical protein